MGIFSLFALNRDSIFGSLNFIPTFVFEFFDVIIMAIAVAYIFEGIFGKVSMKYDLNKYDPVVAYKNRRFDFSKFKFSLYAIAPSVVLHELMHKLVAVSFGVPATFYASYGGLALGIILKLIGSGFIFFVPGFVSIGNALPYQSALISFAGPFANLVLWFVAWYVLKYKSKNLSMNWSRILVITRRVNLFLFFFNMIPIPPFDGGHFFLSLIRMFLGDY